MSNWNRRSWLKTVGLGAIGFVAAGGKFDAQSATGRSPELISVMRLINTRQSRQRRQQGKYQRIADLTPVIALPTHFELSEVLSKDGAEYEIAIRDTRSGKLMRTSQMGVIYETRSERKLADYILEHGQTFAAPAITLEEPSGANRLFASVVGFFVPSLYARSSCFCGTCLGPGECPGGCPDPYYCCNNGTAICTWCCPQSCCVE
jgi:hypothetical protein